MTFFVDVGDTRERDGVGERDGARERERLGECVGVPLRVRVVVTLRVGVRVGEWEVVGAFDCDLDVDLL